MQTLITLADASFTIPIGWALTGFLSLCGAVAGMGKLVFSMCMHRIAALGGLDARVDIDPAMLTSPEP